MCPATCALLPSRILPTCQPSLSDDCTRCTAIILLQPYYIDCLSLMCLSFRVPMSLACTRFAPSYDPSKTKISRSLFLGDSYKLRGKPARSLILQASLLTCNITFHPSKYSTVKSSLYRTSIKMYARPTALACTSPIGTGNITRVVLTLAKASSATAPAKPCVYETRALRSPNKDRCHFSSSSRRSLKEFFPAPHDNVNIKVTPPAWHHPV